MDEKTTLALVLFANYGIGIVFGVVNTMLKKDSAVEDGCLDSFFLLLYVTSGCYMIAIYSHLVDIWKPGMGVLVFAVILGSIFAGHMFGKKLSPERHNGPIRFLLLLIGLAIPVIFHFFL